MSAEKVREYLLTHGVHYEIADHALAYTAQRVAQAEHVSGHQVAKPVILMADDRFVMAVVPATKHVDLDKARLALECDTVRLATEEEFAPAFADCESGAEPPLGGLYEMKTVVDLHFEMPTVTFRGGSHTQTITMALSDYLEIANAERVDIVLGD